MRCEHRSRGKGHCPNEAIGNVSDNYGSQSLCAEHLAPLKGQLGLKIILFSESPKVNINHDHFGHVDFVCPKCCWKASSSLEKQ